LVSQSDWQSWRQIPAELGGAAAAVQSSTQTGLQVFSQLVLAVDEQFVSQAV